MMMPDAFQTEIERFLSNTGMKPTRFGMSAVGDPRFVFDLRKKNREPRHRTMQRVIDFINRSEESSLPASDEDVA
jgi:hypothetical protein